MPRKLRTVAGQMSLRHQGRGTVGQGRVASDRRNEVERIAATYLERQPDIFQHAQILEQIVALERARNSHSADSVGRAPGYITILQPDAARTRPQLPADLVDQACFAG